MTAQKTAAMPTQKTRNYNIPKNKTANAAKTAKTAKKEIKEVKEMKEMKEMKKSKGFFFARILFVTFVVIILFDFASNLHKINSAKSELGALQEQNNSDRIGNDALQQQLDAPVDDDYITNVVKGMGYRKSDEILFYLDSDN